MNTNKACMFVLVTSILVAGLPLLSAEEPAPLAPLPRHAEVARKLAERLPHLHVTNQEFDDTVSERAFDRYLSFLDSQHFYFLKSDIKRFEEKKLQLDNDLKAGDIQFAFDVWNTFVKRVHNRADYVEQLLEKGFDLDKDESYWWRRKDADWPVDEEARDDLWRRRVKNQYVQHILGAEQADEEERKQLKPPDERILKTYKRYLEVINQTEVEWVVQRYLSSFTLAYDPHCHYMSPAAAENFNIDMKLSLVGIGALLSTEEEGTTIVKRIIPGGPASRDKRDVRLQPGDRIIAVAQGKGPAEDIMSWPISKVVKLIRGKKGTTVVLTVIPGSDSTGATTKKVDLVRDEVNLDERGAKHHVREFKDSMGKILRLGVIDLPAFYGDMQAAMERKEHYRSSARDVAKILLKLEQENVDGLVLDLRGNGGGALHEAVQLTGLFVEWGPVVLVKPKAGRGRILADTDPSIAYAGPLVVLINRHSASASEILAGALQDYGRALIVGDSKTLGKGSVQSIVKLGEDDRLGTLRVTSALYYRISGSSTQLKGVISDITIPSHFDKMKIGEDYLDHALEWRMVSELPYRPFTDLVPVVTELTERARKRMAASDTFTTYTNLLDRIRIINEIDELPLNIQKRRKLSLERRELQDLQGTLTKEDSDDKENKDLVLTEALGILADLVSNHPETHVREKAKQMLPRVIKKADVPKETQKEINALVGELGHKDFKIRDAARKKLAALGKIAFPVLEEHRENEDPEVRQIIRSILGD